MKKKSVLTAVIALALSTCLTVVCAPAAFASTVVTGVPSALDSDALAKPDTITYLSVKATTTGNVKVTWKQPDLNGLRYNGYVVFYAYNSSMTNAEFQVLTAKDTSYEPGKTLSTILTNLKQGKTLYIQVRMNALFKGAVGSWDISNGDLSTVKSVKIVAAAKKATPKPKKVSAVKLSSKEAGKVKVSWKASKAKGLKSQTYTVRYAYNKAMKKAKTKTVKAKIATLSKLKTGKKLYVQVRTNAKYGKKTLHSKWSTKRVVTVK